MEIDLSPNQALQTAKGKLSRVHRSLFNGGSYTGCSAHDAPLHC